jgi:lysozyme
MADLIGIDTASVANKTNIDWGKAKAAGIGYAFHRAAYGTQADSRFAVEWPRMKAAGVVRGAYLFLRFPCKSKNQLKVPTPTAQAEAVCKIVGPLNASANPPPSALTTGDYPIALDVEFPGEGQKDTGMTSQQLLAGVKEAYDVLQKFYGVAPIVYTSARVWVDDLRNLPAPWAFESLLWLAKYVYAAGPAVLNPGNVVNPPVPPPWAGTDPKLITYRGTSYSDQDFGWHQFQGNATGCPGVAGVVDMNRLRPVQKGDRGERVKWIQRRLGFAGSAVDGIFGTKTDAAVRKLQAEKNDLVADGIVGARTYAYLCWMNPL